MTFPKLEKRERPIKTMYFTLYLQLQNTQTPRLNKYCAI